VTVRRAADPLELLAIARGVAVSYEDATHRRRTVPPDTLVTVLSALGEEIETPSDAPECLARRASTTERELVPPVAVAWDGRLPEGVVRRLVQGAADASEAVRLELEDGSDGSELLATGPAGTGAERLLPFGLHGAHAGGATTFVISAPRRASPLEPSSWGVFAPTYSLVDERLGATGDLTCLARLGSFAGSLGASYLATLPLLADYSTADAPGAVASPYSPISRMWWNEGYLDVSAIAATDPDEHVSRDIAAGPYADVAGAATKVGVLLERMIARAHPGEGSRRAGYERFRRERPDVERYGAFRAAVRAGGIDREAWPARWKAGDIQPGRDVAVSDVDLHVCAQWLTDEQVASAAASTTEAGCRLMLDLPIGCRPDGYDTWAFPSSFAGGSTDGRGRHGVSVGAPPDRFFGGGQDWGFRPLDPEGERRAGYPVVRGSLAHLLRHAGALRIDHVLGFQRLWWIPSGAAAGEGTYVGYPADELMALACLEAWRHDATLIGEDLGTVDPGVRRLMGEHGITGMTVAVFDLEARPGVPLEPPRGSCALVDTHDTATFAGWLDGTDVQQRLRSGRLDAEAAAMAGTQRSLARRSLLARLAVSGDDIAEVHAAVLEELGRSEAGVVMATLEDLWAEHDPQNIPGTGSGHVNFARRMAKSLQEIESDDDLTEPLRRLERARRDRTTAAIADGAAECRTSARGKVGT
jgi:4-alpha-glucanotransferase